MSFPRTPEPSPAPLAHRQPLYLHELDLLDPLKHELCDPHAARHRHRLGPEVDHGDHQLATVIGVDRRGSVGKGEAVFDREPRARPHLRLVPRWDREREAGADQAALQRAEREVRLGTRDVVSRGACRLSCRQRQSVMMRQAAYLNDRPLGQASAPGFRSTTASNTSGGGSSSMRYVNCWRNASTDTCAVAAKRAS